MENDSLSNSCSRWFEKKPFIVFKGGKREVKRLNELYENKCIVTQSASGWMDEQLTGQYCKDVLRVFTFVSRRLLEWDSFRCHLTPSVREILNKGKIDPVVVPGDAQSLYKLPMCHGINL